MKKVFHKILKQVSLLAISFGFTMPFASAKVVDGLEWQVYGKLKSSFSRVPYLRGQLQSPADSGNYTPYPLDWSKNSIHATNDIRIKADLSDGVSLFGSEELYGFSTTADEGGWIDQFVDIPDQQAVRGKHGQASVAGIVCLKQTNVDAYAGYAAIKARAPVQLFRSIIGISGVPGLFKWWEVLGRQEDDFDLKLVLDGRCPYVEGNINNVWSDAFGKMTVDEIANVTKSLPSLRP